VTGVQTCALPISSGSYTQMRTGHCPAQARSRRRDELALVARLRRGAGQWPVRICVYEPEVCGRERTVAKDPRLELLDVRERANVDGPPERRLERLAVGTANRADRRLEAVRPRTKDDGEQSVVSRIRQGFRPTV